MLDTVGFISDIPIDLIASFNATLEDAALADLIVHVRDVSNPDHEAQVLLPKCAMVTVILNSGTFFVRRMKTCYKRLEGWTSRRSS